MISTKIIKIGNSKGIRIPAKTLEQLNITNEVLLDVKKDSILIKPKVTYKPRNDWDEQMKKNMVKDADRTDIVWEDDIINDYDNEE